MKKVFLFTVLIFFSAFTFAQNDAARWLRYPSISPDGQTIAFGYMGNIYTVSAQGGVATPLTVGSHYKERPVWSNDGKTIAFSSDRYGNFDVYTIPATGGQATRITYHSADDYAYDFTPDNKKILFGSNREAPAKSVRFPGTRYFPNLYTIPVKGGRALLVTAAGAENAHYNTNGSKIVFQDKKGYEDYWRKHEVAAITRDIWVYDIPNNSYKELTHTEIDNRVPSFNAAGNAVYYTNQKSGDFNVYKQSLADGNTTQLTHFENFPVRALTVSDQNKMAFSWKGDVYTLTEGQQPKKLTVRVLNSAGYNTIDYKNISSVSEFTVSPDGKEVAFINRGEVFVTAVDNNQTKRITNTPTQERMLTWSPDGKTLVYSGERDGNWNIYKVTLEHPEEQFFYAATTLKTEPLVATSAQEYQPDFSPDGKKLAYVENRNILKVLDLKTGKKVTVLPEGQNFSYSDGDWGYQWSPDSKWLLVDDSKGYFSISNTALISADGKGDVVFPVNSGFGDSDAKWALGGKLMTYKSSRLGRKPMAYQGRREEDVYGVFFDQKAYDQFTMSEEEYKLMKARKKDDKKKEDDDKDKKKKKKDEDKKADKTLKLDLHNLNQRKVRLTINSTDISDYVLSKDGSKLYYLASFQKGYNLWVTEPRTRKTKVLTHLNGSGSQLVLSKDGKYLFLTNRGRLMKINTHSGKTQSIAVHAKMVVNHEAERQYIFNHIWKQTKDKLYDPNMHGTNWDFYHKEYGKFLPYINNNYDFQVLLSEFLGELDVSHTGGRYSPRHSDAQRTASLGLLYDQKYNGPGIKIEEVIAGGPFDKADSNVKKGDIITAINGHKIAAGENWTKLLTNLSGEATRITFKRGSKTFDKTIKPISLGREHNLMYERWVRTMSKMVDSLSHGQLGYVHIKGMNDGSFRHVYAKVLGKDRGKKGLVVDTRFNGGGWLHNDLNTFLSGKQYLTFWPQGHPTKGGEPLDRWTKPSIMLISEGNYSDAFITPFIYQQNGLGKLVGMPVAGTGTAVWWERQIDPTIVFGIPMVATMGFNGKVTENQELHPDIQVPLPYHKFLSGEDTQLEAAVKELLKEVK